MKKLMLGIAALAAGSVMAIESNNTVGYASKECKAGEWYMIGCGFENVSGGALNIQDFISGLEARDDNSSFIQVWNGTKLDTYYYQMLLNWDTFEEYPAWAQGGEEVSFDVPAGFACWFKEPKKDVTITVAGQVVAPSTKPVTMEADTWYMVANPYPVSTALNGGLIDWSGIEARDDNSAFIQVWNGTKLDTYYYQKLLNWDTFEEYAAWAQGGEAVDIEIPAQTGFWIKVPKTGGSFTWKKFNN